MSRIEKMADRTASGLDARSRVQLLHSVRVRQIGANSCKVGTLEASWLERAIRAGAQKARNERSPVEMHFEPSAAKS